MPGTVWFTVLPDSAAASVVAEKLRPRASHVVHHASGRPWLIAAVPAREITITERGEARLVVIGRSSATATSLTRLAGNIRDTDVDEIEHAVGGLAGSFHLAVSVAGRTWVRGSASAVRRVFHTEVAGVTIAADRPDVLAPLIGADVDERVVAFSLLSPEVTYPLGERCVWRGVRGVPADHGLLVERDGGHRTTRWWEPPRPTLSRAQGAQAVRQALTEAVETCTSGGGTVTADMSGGWDSTSLCFLAARSAERLITVRQNSLDPANDDDVWARRAEAALPEIHHLLIDQSHLPAVYDDLMDPTSATEEPYRGIAGRALMAGLAERVRELGSRLHLNGMGGDELFYAAPVYLHDLIGSRPIAALRRLRQHRAGTRWPLATTVRALAERGRYDRSLATAGDDLFGPPPQLSTVDMRWVPELRLPPWATAQAADIVRAQLRTASDDAPRPLAPRRAQHVALEAVRSSGLLMRQVDQVTRQSGVPLAVPYLDDAVVRAALSIRPEERWSPYQFKPVLAEAMRGILPESNLTRATKGAFDTDVYTALDQRLPEILALAEDSCLARLGLLDADRLRTALLSPDPTLNLLSPLDATLGCEVWLRSLAHQQRPAAAVVD